MEQIFPLIRLQKAKSHSTLALIYSKQQPQQDEKCNEHRLKALEISEQLISNGEKIEGIGDVFEHIGELYMNQSNPQRARKYYKKALGYTKKDMVDDHPEIRRIQKIIDGLPTSRTTD
ncbi:unnamed protein product [Rotaria sp. Silwood1]|nr:unnamed protein product [Rotaria sp. Silwood1]CAF5102772.1 unnamed protein product [Rotaria sp. Silwood1]